MRQHEAKKCPRCGNGFECKQGSITQCQCYGITVTLAMKYFIEKRYADCLCSDCLIYLQSEANLFYEQFRKQ